ncbi:MAG: hypothetical protein AB7U82_28715 [Blastocatellales bacterium]
MKDEHARSMIKAVIEQEITYCNYARERKDWFNLYHQVGKDESKHLKLPTVGTAIFIISITVASLLSLHLFRSL